MGELAVFAAGPVFFIVGVEGLLSHLADEACIDFRVIKDVVHFFIVVAEVPIHTAQRAYVLVFVGLEGDYPFALCFVPLRAVAWLGGPA